jgi:putative endonuclease
LYTGVTNNLQIRVYLHANGFSKFTSKYRINRLVYFETAGGTIEAIAREKQIKGLDRATR